MKQKIAVILIIMMIASIGLYFLNSASATTPTIYLESSNNVYTTDTAYLGMKFNITVWCTNVPDLGGAQIYMEFNDTIINVTRWWTVPEAEGGFMPDPIVALPAPPDPGYVHLGPGLGRIQIAISKGGLPPQPPWGHDGKIAIIEFNITKMPTQPGEKYSTVLKIDDDSTYLLDTTAGEIPNVTKQNGYYEIKKPGPKYQLEIRASAGGTTDPTPGTYIYELGTIVTVTAIPFPTYTFKHWELNGTNAGSINPFTLTIDANYILEAIFVYSPPEGSRIFVDPSEIIMPEAVPCETNFDINISIDDVADMKLCEFNLTYNTDILSIIGFSFPSVNGQYPLISIIANETVGYAWISLNYPASITVSEPTSIVKLSFHVDNLGATPLNITDTSMVDSFESQIDHDVYHGFFIAQIRDVAITDVSVSRNWAYLGGSVNITVTVKNKGNISESVDVYAYYDSYVIGTQSIANLLPNEEKELFFVWDTTGVPEGNYTIKAEVLPVPYEINTSDNMLIDGEVWIMTHIHDIAVINVTSESWVYPGWIAHINVTAKNLGEFTESFEIKAYYNITLIGTISVTNLPPGNIYVAQFTLNTTSLPPCQIYVISGEATTVLYEYDDTNNLLENGLLKIRFIGDVNGDDKVDLKDVYQVSLAFGSYPGHPRWDPACDINRDDAVDLKDVYTVSKNYGQGCFS
jgi:hypothetical protein